jgi:hypothetical protein
MPERWLGSVEIAVVGLVVVALLLRTLVSLLAGGAGVEQGFAAGIVAARVLDQRPRR